MAEIDAYHVRAAVNDQHRDRQKGNGRKPKDENGARGDRDRHEQYRAGVIPDRACAEIERDDHRSDRRRRHEKAEANRADVEDIGSINREERSDTPQ